ncbi:MAG: CYTH domain-containing protein [Schleiferiaceae bacterium]
MALEIERKFLVIDDSWKSQVVQSHVLKQGYLASSPGPTVRIRTSDESAFLTIKGKTIGISRVEFEYEVPMEEALDLLKLSTNTPIEKTRHIIKADGHVWEIDVFEGANQGLVLAEVELRSEDEQVILPSWIGSEVSHDPRYFNSYLSENPFSNWKEN